MKLNVILSSILVGAGLSFAMPYNSSDYVENAASRQIAAYQQKYNEWFENILASRGSEGNCTAENIVHRQEWGSLSNSERGNYVDAVMCLINLPAQSDPTIVPGARSRYDDFVANHIMMSNLIHHDGLFLTWHRYFTWLYEQALIDECGYVGAQPYWDWTLAWKDWRSSSVLDGTFHSMGGNGVQISPHPSINDTSMGSTRLLPPGTGGGCVESGPFAQLTINLGPVALLSVQPQNPQSDGLGYNPRCLTRDIAFTWSNNTRPTDILELIAGSCSNVECFDNLLEGLSGVHAGGHFGVGGIMADQSASPSDPLFFLHHAMIDRVWSLWQSRNPEIRTGQTFGTVTANNMPPSANATLDSELTFGILSSEKRVGDLVSSLDGPFCYQYI